MAPSPKATHTRKTAPPKTVPRANSATPLLAAARPTATFSASKPERTAAMAKIETLSRPARPTRPSSRRSVAQITITTPTAKSANGHREDQIIPKSLSSPPDHGNPTLVFEDVLEKVVGVERYHLYGGLVRLGKKGMYLLLSRSNPNTRGSR